MSDSVESIHAKINEKILAARVGITALREIDASVPCNLMLDDLETITTRYNFATVEILAEYYRSLRQHGMGKTTATPPIDTLGDVDRLFSEAIAETAARRITEIRNIPTGNLPQKLAKRYYKTVTSEGVINKISDVCDRACAYLKNTAAYERVRRQFDICKNIQVVIQIEKSNYEKCAKCGCKMEVVPTLSELKCLACGRTKILYGTVFEDHQFYNQEGQKTKHGSYDPNRHFRFWMDRIQAREKHAFDEASLNSIAARIARYYEGVGLTCSHMRKILKECELTRFNDHIPLLVKHFTGRAPPQLTHNEMRTFAIKFNKIMEIYEQVVKQNKEGNRPYYPYFIYKIAEEEFRDLPEKLRILEFIHLQSEETIIKHDLIYKQICESAPEESGLVYRTTNTACRR